MQEKVVLINHEEKYIDIITKIEQEQWGYSFRDAWCKECGCKPCKCTNVIFVKEIG